MGVVGSREGRGDSQMAKQQLQDLLNQWFGIDRNKTRAEKASVRSLIWGQLWHYIREQSYEIVQKEISNITTVDELNVLLGVGCPRRIWKTVTKQINAIEVSPAVKYWNLRSPAGADLSSDT